MSKFKKGDVVIIIKALDSFAKIYLNSTGIVREVSDVTGYNTHVEFVEGGSAVFFTQELELLSVYESPLWKALL